MKYSQADLQANTAAIGMYKVIYRIKSLTVNYNKNKQLFLYEIEVIAWNDVL